MLKILFLSVCYTIAFYTSTMLASHFSPLLLIGFRGLISGVLLLGVHNYTTKTERTNLKRYKFQYFLAIILGFIIPFILSAAVLDKLPMVDSTILATCEPIITYLLAAYFFSEKLNRRQVLYLISGTAFAFAAVLIEAQLERVSLISWQESIVILIAVFLAAGWLAISKLTSLNEPEDAIMGIGFVSTGAIASLAAMHFEQIKFSVEIMPILLFLLMVFFGDLIVTRMRVKLSKKYSATLLSLVCIFVPFIVATHEQIFKHQQYSYKFFLIIIPSLICFSAFYYEERKLQTKKL